MAVFRAISRALMTWLRACLRPPLPVRPLRAGTATTARSPIMPTTARSSTRVKADCSRKGRKGRKGRLVVGDWRTDCSRKERKRRSIVGDWETDCSRQVRQEREAPTGSGQAQGADAGKGVKEITIKISTPVIYIVNNCLQSKYWKMLIKTQIANIHIITSLASW